MGVQFAGNILVQSDGGPLPIISGGTGQTSATEAITALLPTQTGQAGKALVTNGTLAAWQNISGAPGGSDTYIQYNDAGTFGGSSFLTVNKVTGAITSTSTLTNQGLTISKAVSNRDVKYQTSGSDRWFLRTNSTAEAGSESGSDFQLIRIADNGSTQNIAYTVSRATGVVDFATAPTIAGVPLTSDAASLTGTTLATNVTNSSLTTLGTITTGTWSATAIAANKGGTGQTSYTVGDILYANTGSTLSKLVAGTSGFVLTSNGAGTAPSWQTAGGAPTLTSTQVGFGSGSNLLTSSSDFTFSGQTLSIGVFTNTNSARLNVTGLISSGIDNGNGGPLAIRPAILNGNGPGYDLTLTGGTSVRAGGAVNITGGVESTNGFGGGNVNITGGGGFSGTGFAGSVVIAGGVGTSQQGGVIFKTANTTRFSLNGDGSWQVGGTGGTSGQVLTSSGNTSAPTWTTVAGAFNGGTITSALTISAANPQLILGNTTNSGRIVSVVNAAGAGQTLQLVAANATTSGQVGGNLNLTSGAASGVATGGVVSLNAGNTGAASTYDSILINGAAHTGSGPGGSIAINSGTSSAGTGGAIYFTSGGSGFTSTERFRILNNGAWSVGSTGTATGTSGQVLTSTGATTPPTWTSGSGTFLNATGAYTTTPQNTTGVYVGLNASFPRIFFTNTAAATGKRNSQVYNNNTNLIWTFVNDASTLETAWLTVATPTNNASQVAPSITLNTNQMVFGDGATTITPATGIATGAVSSWLTTPNVASTAANNILIMPGQNTTITAGAATIWVSGALRNNSGTAGTAALIGGQNTSTGTAGDVVVAAGNQTGSTTGAGGNAFIYGGQGGSSGTGGYISLQTPLNATQIERLRILNNGAWSVGSTGTATGTSGQALVSSGSTTPPAWGTPTSATNIAGLATNNILYQSASGTTTGTNAFQWIAGSNTLQLGNAATFISGGSTNLLFTIQGLDAAGAVAAPVLIRGGNGTGSGGAGGALTLQAGNTAIGTGKDITVQGGTGSSAGGNIVFQTAATTSLATRLTISPTSMSATIPLYVTSATSQGLGALSGSATALSCIGVGRTAIETSLAVTGLVNQYFNSTAVGDTVLATSTSGAKIWFGNTNTGNASMYVDTNYSVGIGYAASASGGTMYLRGAAGTRPGIVYENAGVNYWNVALKGDAGQNYYQISNGAETVGVYMTPSASGWNNLSDERFKENWNELTDAATKIKTLRAGTFTWIADPTLPQDVGLIAQDVQAVLPEAVDDSNPDRLGVRYSATIPLLVKALQEALARIEVLEAQVAAL